MNLASYISDPERRAALARALDTSPRYLWQLAANWRGRKAGPLMARRIEEATDGQVTKESLRPDVFGPPPADEGQGGDMQDAA